MNKEAVKQLLERAFGARREDLPEDALRYSRDAVELCRSLTCARQRHPTDAVSEQQ